eukprot:8437255-Alexandrium_andersonii.AAC.1
MFAIPAFPSTVAVDDARIQGMRRGTSSVGPKGHFKPGLLEQGSNTGREGLDRTLGNGVGLTSPRNRCCRTLNEVQRSTT